MSILSFEELRGDHEVSVDVVVVGSGPGGAAVARALAEGGQSVAIIEEGPPTPRFRPNQAHAMRYHMQEQGSMIAQGNLLMPIAAGRGVGGGSLINSAICFRTPDHVLEKWTALLGDDRYGPEAMRGYFDEVGAIIEVGPTSIDIAGENNKLIVRGAKKLGLPTGLVHRNAPRCVGCGMCNFGCPSGGKASVDLNLIPLARAAGAMVYADTRVDTLLTEGDRVAGISGEVRNTDTGEPVGRLTVRAGRVVLSAGAVGTPRLLHSTGLADKMSSQVGENLHCHPGNGVFGRASFPVQMWRGATQGAYFEDPVLPGVLPHTMSLPPGAMMLALGGAGGSAKEFMKQAPFICGCLVMVSDTSRGSVRANADGTAKMSYWLNDEDEARIRAGVVRTAEVLLAGGADEVFVPARGGMWTADLKLVEAHMDQINIRDFFAMYAAHPMGTCRMATSASEGVVDPSGAAFGVRDLYIADASVFPSSLGVNPQWTTMALATAIGRGMLA